MAKLSLTGGLDLMTVKPLARPGTLSECLNHEVSALHGYSRIGGLARFDGSEDVGAYKVWRVKHVGGSPFVVGTQAWFDPALKGWVLSVAVQGTIHITYLLMPGIAPAPGLPANLMDGTNTASILNRDALFEGKGTQGNFDAGLAIIAADQKSRIGAVPGRAGSDIIGGFYYKDRAYVIRDLPRIGFQDGYYTDADEGKYITIGGVNYEILSVLITGTNSGILTYDTEPMVGGTPASPLGPAVLVELPVTGSLDDGYTFIPYSDGLGVSGGVAPYTWSLTGEEGTQIDPVESPDANAINFIPQFTNAALYRSSPDGWERVNLGREMAFNAGTTSIKNFIRNALLTGATPLTTSFVYPTTGSVNGVANPNMGADDGTDAPLGAATQYDDFLVGGFDFSMVPENATIVGIEVQVDRHSNTANQAKDRVVELVVPNGTLNKAKGAAWPNAPAVATYGGPSDLWGAQTIEGSVIRDPQFGVRVITQRVVPGTPYIGGIDFIRVRITYVEKDTKIYVWDGTSDVIFTLQNTQIITGATDNSSAAGFMSLAGDQNADKARLVNEGDQIRSAPAGGGNLLAVVAARDVPVWLAGQAELDNNRARYQFERTNFYGQDEFESVYGACGASPAFAFDGIRLIRIRTQLPPALDLPRHITRHGDMLVLGFYPGAIVFSPPGDPLNMRAEDGAVSVEVGDRLVGLRPMAGDALGIIMQSSTQLIRGTVPESFQKSPVSNNRGGIEYTAVDMGRVILCDGLGIFAADTPESFGAAERNYISQPVHPWLKPRLQAAINSESSFLRPVAALNVRNKNQMRLYFWDGWMLTMTMNEPPEFTTQRYFTPAPDEFSEPTPWTARTLFTGIDSSGREHLFISFYGGIKEGYLFEMDSGRSFDGDDIPAYIVTNPVNIESVSREKRYDKAFVHGAGYGHASVGYSKLIDDGDEPKGLQTFNFGKTSTKAKIAPKAMRGVVDSPAEAFDISMRFDSLSSTSGEYTLQYVELTVDNRGESRGRQGSS